jgi:hypothetical protein
MLNHNHINTPMSTSIQEERELKQLRLMREIHLGIQDLECQLSNVAKRYRTGIRLLKKEISNQESHLDMGLLPGMEDTLGVPPEIAKLIVNPVLSNIPSDNKV